MGSWECSSIGRGVPPGPVTIQPSINTLYSILNWKFQDLHPIWCMIFIIKCFVFTPMEMSPCQWKAENKEFCLALRVIELEGFFRVSYLLWHEECFCKITPNPHNLWDLSLWIVMSDEYTGTHPLWWGHQWVPWPLLFSWLYHTHPGNTYNRHTIRKSETTLANQHVQNLSHRTWTLFSQIHNTRYKCMCMQGTKYMSLKYYIHRKLLLIFNCIYYYRVKSNNFINM